MPLKLHLVFTFKVKVSRIRFFKPAVKYGRGSKPPRAIWDRIDRSGLYSEGGTLHLNRHSTLIISVTDYGKVRV